MSPLQPDQEFEFEARGFDVDGTGILINSPVRIMDDSGEWLPTVAAPLSWPPHLRGAES